MKRVLFCVLNWGLGHATRSTPIIAYLLELGCEVQLASDGLALAYLKNRFSDLHCISLPDYKAMYPSTSVVWNVAVSLKSIQKAIEDEKRVVRQVAKEFRPDIIISDNRYGCFCEGVLNVLISHQLKPIAPNTLSQGFVNWMIKRKLKPFNQLWVPDAPPPKNLTGAMSELNDNRTQYIGHLSTLKKPSNPVQLKRLLILLSGPEPARSKFERKILALELCDFFSCQLIRGTDIPHRSISSDYLSTNLADEKTVGKAIAEAEFIICRSGYSTIMDLLALGKKALYVPTPGQPEQAYLAKMVANQGFGIHLKEKEISRERISQALEQLNSMAPFEPLSKVDFKLAIDSIME